MNAIGIILADRNRPELKELTARRVTAALPMFGIYRVIDFPLTNMARAGVEKVAVMAQYNTKSLDEHLSSERWWNFGSKRGGLYVYHPVTRPEEPNFYQGNLDAMAQNIHFLRGSHEPYVVIASGAVISQVDYEDVLEAHIEKNADLTIVTGTLRPWEDSSKFGLVETDDADLVTRYEPEPAKPFSREADTGTYIIRRRLLIELLEKAVRAGKTDFAKDILVPNLAHKKIYAYHMDGYFSEITSKMSYYQTNMDFLDEELNQSFFKANENILTRINDLPPAKFDRDCQVKHSMIAPGTMICGTVENSIISKKAYIGKNCIVKNAIILYDVYVDDGCRIENCILESYNTIEENESYVNTDQNEITIIRENSNRFLI